MTRGFNHFDEAGHAVMVDVSGKGPTERSAVAKGSIRVSQETMDAVIGRTTAKGDVLGVARIAGIMATKRTADLIPLCHPLALSHASMDFVLHEEKRIIDAVCTVRLTGSTGVEMEALTGASTALLTIYDMCKAIDKRMVLTDIHLVSKEGGKSGGFKYDP